MRRHQLPIRQSKEGLGGFFEALLAIMIVTSGFTILLVSVNLVQVDERRNSEVDVQASVNAIIKKLLDDKRIFLPPYILLLGNEYLWSGIAREEFAAFTNYSVILILDLERPHYIVLAEKGFESRPDEIISLRLPVDVQITPSMIHVGILEVKVGA